MSLINSFTTRNAYSTRELFSVLCNYQLCAGIPQLSTNAGQDIISFQIDSLNSIWICPKGGVNYTDNVVRSQYWSVLKFDHEPGIDNMIAKDALDFVTGGITGTISLLGSNARKGYALVDQLVMQINSLGL